MRYRLWQRIKPYCAYRSPWAETKTINDDAHDLLFEWHFWTFEEAINWGKHVQEVLKGCLGEHALYYQIYDTCLSTFYERDGYRGSCALALQNHRSEGASACDDAPTCA